MSKIEPSIFLTQAISTMQARKAIVSGFVAESDKSEAAELTKNAE